MARRLATAEPRASEPTTQATLRTISSTTSGAWMNVKPSAKETTSVPDPTSKIVRRFATVPTMYKAMAAGRTTKGPG